MFNAENAREASEKALSVLLAVKAKPMNGDDAPSSWEVAKLVDLFRHVRDQRTMKATTLADWNRAANAFLDWLNVNEPTVQTWAGITTAVAQEYTDSFKGRAFNTQRLGLVPLKTVGNWMAKREFRNPWAQVEVMKASVRPPSIVTIDDVLQLMDWTDANSPNMTVAIGLSGLAGLRQSEVFRLTWGKVEFGVNLGAGDPVTLVEVSGEVKNEWSQRVIPVVERLADALKREHRRQFGNVVPIDWKNRPVVQSSVGTPFSRIDAFSSAIRDAMRGCFGKPPFAPGELRNCIFQVMDRTGKTSNQSEAYCGHAPRGVTARHYLARLSGLTAGQRRALLAAALQFQTMVAETLELEIATCGDLSRKDVGQVATGAAVLEL